MGERVDFVISEVPFDVGHLRDCARKSFPVSGMRCRAVTHLSGQKRVRRPLACTVFDFRVSLKDGARLTRR